MPPDTAPALPGVEPWPTILRDFLLVVVFNTIIAVLFATLIQHGFGRSFVYSQCVGVTIFSITKALMRLRRTVRLTAGIMAVSVPAGSVVGMVLGYFLVRLLFGDDPPPGLLPGSIVGSLIFGVAISYYFYSQKALAEQRAAIQAQAVRQLESDKRTSEAELRALQAQIEPHFLFNTLSNVASLIDSDPAAAKRMLTNFTAYLRGTLDRSRAERTTLGQELELVRRYLEIMAIRMGPRLGWKIDTDASVSDLSLPPLVLQPFVENAIRHGLEPMPEGGQIVVSARQSEGFAEIAVSDTGAGWPQHATWGVGIENVRKRLEATFGSRAEVTIHAVEPHGVSVRLRIPVASA